MENYFWNTEETQSVKKLYVLIIYDIVDNKKRLAFAKKLNGYGFRVQKSAFEAMITESLYRKLIDEIPRMIDKALVAALFVLIYFLAEAESTGRKIVSELLA